MIMTFTCFLISIHYRLLRQADPVSSDGAHLSDVITQRAGLKVPPSELLVAFIPAHLLIYFGLQFCYQYTGLLNSRRIC